jgi:uncharacterized protein YbaP (TraB family)
VDKEQRNALTGAAWKDVLEKAAVPEHSVFFMRAMSGGEPFVEEPYLFIAAADWLVAVGYPLSGHYDPAEFERALGAALHRTKANDCWAVCPSLPAGLRSYLRQQDQYYVLPADALPPGRPGRLAERAAASLRVEEGRTFTSAHRRLWAEFVTRKALPLQVRELFARTETVLSDAPGLVLLNAWDTGGHLAACLLLDLAPRRFLSYLIGAHSRSHYTAYASDLLFREMTRIARREGKEFLHLGLGIDAGLRRFKTKWGGRPAVPYEMAAWREEARRGATALPALLAAHRASVSKWQYVASLPPRRPYAMLWEVEKDGRRSWIGGTAHFFRCSFEPSFRTLFAEVDAVLFEGPLDAASLDQVSVIGASPEPGAPRLTGALSEEDIRRLEKIVCGPRGFWARQLNMEYPNAPDVRFFLSETRPWMAFFSLWSGFLARKGWQQSVDRDAWHVARDMEKFVCTLETIAEQIETLERIPLPRIADFMRRCDQWNAYIRRYERRYLKGDLESLRADTAAFPTRTEPVIDRRDPILLERMLPLLEECRCAVFVGTLHLFNLLPLLAEAGFTVRKGR